MLFVCFSLSLLFTLIASWHLNVNLLCPETFFVLGHPLLLTLLPHTFGSVMRRPNRTSLRTFLEKAFIWNAKSFCQTSPTLTYPLSFTVGVGSHCVTSRSLVYPCLSRSSTSTCMDLIIRYFSLLLALRYVHCGHTGYCIQRAPYPQGSASWLPWLWAS